MLLHFCGGHRRIAGQRLFHMNIRGLCGQQAEVDHLYELLAIRIAKIKERHGGRLPTARDLPRVRRGSGTKGVYFFFENGELRDDKVSARVVRIGTHKKGNIESRVAEHRTDWKRSIFRRHVGTALLRKGSFDHAIKATDRDMWASEWIRRVGGWSVHMNKGLLNPTLHPLHTLVTEAIGNMRVVWVEIEEQERRLAFETLCIQLLSNYLRKETPIDPPSPNWLGHYALSEEIRLSGLWNVECAATAHPPGLLQYYAANFGA